MPNAPAARAESSPCARTAVLNPRQTLLEPRTNQYRITRSPTWDRGHNRPGSGQPHQGSSATLSESTGKPIPGSAHTHLRSWANSSRRAGNPIPDQNSPMWDRGQTHLGSSAILSRTRANPSCIAPIRSRKSRSGIGNTVPMPFSPSLAKSRPQSPG